MNAERYILSDSDVEDSFFALQIKSVAITKRYPAQGLPPKGVPMSIDVEVETAGNAGYFLRYPLSTLTCPNAVVVAREHYVDTPRILGHVSINTDALNGCVGSNRLTLKPDYRPNSKSWIVLEVYEEGVSADGEYNFNNRKPVYVSQPIQLITDLKTGRDAGIYSKPAPSILDTDGGLGNVAANFNSIGKTILGLAFGYIVFSNRETIKKSFTRLSNNLEK
ncbi:MAG: hypothetical protein ACQETE_01605 [Bacteroidota bacterium]